MKTITLKVENLQRQNQTRSIQMALFFAICSLQIHAKNAIPQSVTKKMTVETNRIWINATNTQGAFSQTLFGYRTGATDGYDQGIDGAFWNDGSIAFASLIGETRYAIQFKGLPFVNSDTTPLSFKATTTGTYTFAIDHVDGLFLNPNQPIYVYDNVTNIYTNLKSTGYTFSCVAGTYNNRFVLTYSLPLGIEQNQFTSDDIIVYNDNSSLTISSSKNLILKSVLLYTITGQLLYENKDVNSEKIIITNLSLAQKTIIAKVSTTEGISVSKKCLCLN